MVRPARPADVASIVALEAENLGRDAWSAGLVEQGVCGELPTVTYLVAEVDDRVVGYAAASIVADIGELQRIAVTSARRRTGLASALLEAVVAEATRQGAEKVLLEVREDNHGAAAFYAAQGFVEIDCRRRYYRDGATAIVLCRALDGRPG